MKIRKTVLAAAVLCLTLAACAAPEPEPWEPPATTAPIPSDTTEPSNSEPVTVPTDPSVPSEPVEPSDPTDPTLPDLGPHIHRYGKWTVQRKATCQKEGTKARYCDCGEQEVKAYLGEHSYSEWVVTLEATCTAEGTESRSCSVCKTEQSQSIPALGHDEVITPGLPATCTTSGIADRIDCGRCGEVLQENHPIPPAHDTVIIGYAAPICGRIGQTEGSYCRSCGEVFKVSEILPALKEHQPVVTKGKAATCTDFGTTDQISCKHCHELIQMAEPIPRLGHDMKDGVCSRCGHNCDHGVDPSNTAVKGASEEVLEHFDARSCGEYPYDVLQCSLCGEKSRLATAQAHELHDLFDFWTQLRVVIQPTPDRTGMMERQCRVCNYTQRYSVMAVPAALEDRFEEAGAGELAYHAGETVTFLIRDLRPGGSSAVKFTALENDKLQLTWTGPEGEEQSLVLEAGTDPNTPVAVGQINPDGSANVKYVAALE